ncbi:MAG: hypothetical protein K2O73_10165 [Lachnospiraceae bacterium]|nr:hypothetical protein [Lachnospiraceae bacterium]MDE7434845.1 hypothetical protein [Lachnospiraceae bacterium]
MKMENVENRTGKKECKKSSKTVRKKNSAGDVRGKVITLCLCIVLLGTATYAWFTVSNTPRVTNLALIAGTSGNLKIADYEQGPYGDVLDLATGSGGNMRDVELNPTTTQNGRDFYAPLYTEERVTGVEDIPSGELNTNYVYEKTFYLKAETENSSTRRTRRFDVFFAGTHSDGGTYINNASNNSSAASAVRISFTLADGTTFIYEPNTDVHVSGVSATNGLASGYGGYSTIQQSSNRRFAGSPDNNSQRLFTVTENTPMRVTMRVWIEGTDPDCINDISASEIIGQIQFVSKEVTQ